MSDRQERQRWLLIAAIVGLSVGGALWLAGQHVAANAVWAITTVIGGVPLLIDVVRSLLHGHFGVDVIAALAIVGSLALEQYLAGAVIALMLSTGKSLEAYADRRAHRELSGLLARAPRQAHRYDDGALVDVPIEDVRLGDRLFVKAGEVVPVDGLLETNAVLDESALTGESQTGGTSPRRPHPIGGRERGRGLRCARNGDRRRQHVRRHRPPCAGSERGEGSVRAARGSVRRDLRAGHPGACGGRMGGERGRHPRPVRPRRGHAVSAPARRADRDRRGDLTIGEARDHREGGRCPRDAGPRDDPDVRQDGDPHVGRPGDRRRRELRPARRRTSSSVWRRRSTRSPRTCWQARSSEPLGSEAWSCHSPRTSARSTAQGSRGPSKGGRWPSGRRRSSRRAPASGAARGRSVGEPSWRARPACSSPSTAWWRARS